MKAFGHLRQRTVMDRNLAFEDLDYVRGIFMSGLADKVHPILSFFNLADNISCGADCELCAEEAPFLTSPVTEIKKWQGKKLIFIDLVTYQSSLSSF